MVYVHILNLLKGNFVSTGDIYVYSQLIPSDNFANFPAFDLMVLITQKDIYLHLNGSLGGTGINDPNAAIMCIANDTTEIETNVILRGSTVSNSLITGQNAYVYYEEGIGNELPSGVPQFKNILFTLNWQEIIE